MLTPHSAAQTDEGLVNMATGVARDVLAVLTGHTPENPVNDPLEVERTCAANWASNRSIGRCSSVPSQKFVT